MPIKQINDLLDTIEQVERDRDLLKLENEELRKRELHYMDAITALDRQVKHLTGLLHELQTLTRARD